MSDRSAEVITRRIVSVSMEITAARRPAAVCFHGYKKENTQMLFM